MTQSIRENECNLFNRGVVVGQTQASLVTNAMGLRPSCTGAKLVD